MSADTWYAISLAGYFAALIGLIITVILYFRLDILDVIGDLTGRTVAKEIKSMRENRSSGAARRSVRPKPPRTGKTAKTSRKTLGNSRATSGPGRSRRGTAGLTATGGSQPDKRVLHSRTDRLPQELEEQYGSFDPRVEYSRTDILPQTPEKPEAPAAEQRKRGTAILEESAGGTEQRQRGTAVLEESGGGTALLQEPSKGTALLQEPGGGTTLLTGEEPTLPVKFSVTRSWLVVHTEERIEETE